jgi:hypothetical protein
VVRPEKVSVAILTSEWEKRAPSLVLILVNKKSKPCGPVTLVRSMTMGGVDVALDSVMASWKVSTRNVLAAAGVVAIALTPNIKNTLKQTRMKLKRYVLPITITPLIKNE